MLEQNIHALNVLLQSNVETEDIPPQPQDELEHTFEDDIETHEFVGDKMIEDDHEQVLQIYIQKQPSNSNIISIL
jgi:hypothetical protein